MRQQLVRSIDGMAEYLNRISRWYNIGNEPFGHIKANTQTSYIYEFYCYVKFVEDLSRVGNIIEFDNTGAQGSFFPKAPAEKNLGWAKFVIRDDSGRIIYDVSGGVNIHHNGIPYYTYAADISIQLPNDVPFENHLLLVVDAKYIDPTPKANPRKVNPHILPIRQLREFHAVLTDYSLPKTIPANLILVGTSFPKPTIVTNGSIDVNHNHYAAHGRFIQQGGFHP